METLYIFLWLPCESLLWIVSIVYFESITHSLLLAKLQKEFLSARISTGTYPLFRYTSIKYQIFFS